MLGKPHILSLFPNSFNKFIKNEHSCKILFFQIRVISSFDLVFGSESDLGPKLFAIVISRQQ